MLNETLFLSLPHACAELETWPRDCNDARPHSKLGWMTPRDSIRAQSGAGRARLGSTEDSRCRWMRKGGHVTVGRLWLRKFIPRSPPMTARPSSSTLPAPASALGRDQQPNGDRSGLGVRRPAPARRGRGPGRVDPSARHPPKLGDPAPYIAPASVELLAPEYGVEDPEMRRGIRAGTCDPLPIPHIAGQIGVHQRVPEPGLAFASKDQQMLDQE